VRDEIKISDEPERGDPGGSYMREDGIPEALKLKYFTPTKTLRDEFAMAALTGLLANPNRVVYRLDVEEAYAYADAMLRAREARE
jgi:hypothetical protein